MMLEIDSEEKTLQSFCFLFVFKFFWGRRDPVLMKYSKSTLPNHSKTFYPAKTHQKEPRCFWKDFDNVSQRIYVLDWFKG